MPTGDLGNELKRLKLLTVSEVFVSREAPTMVGRTQAKGQDAIKIPTVPPPTNSLSKFLIHQWVKLPIVSWAP